MICAPSFKNYKMSMQLCCSLCCTPCQEYKSLQNKCGECNEIYEITIKYFDPMLLTGYINALDSKESGVVCLYCWLHIKDFHEFHQTILKTRLLLQHTNIQNSPLHIKLEEEHITVVSNDSDQEFVQCKDLANKNDLEDDTNTIGDDSEIAFDKNECEENPFIVLKSFKNFKENENNVEEDQKQLDYNSDLKYKPKYRDRKCKSKDFSKTCTILDSGNATDNDKTVPSKTRKLKSTKNQKKKNPSIHPALEKFRRHNEFIAEWKSKLECDVCGETLSDFDFLKVHFKDKHNARCYVKCCDRTFYRRCSLVEHIRMHVNPEMHKCDICGKISASKYNLTLHKRTVHEESQPKFKCNVCEKIFKQKPNLERHLLTHITGNKDFKCNECDRAYVLEVQLKAHIKLVHNDNRVCDQCGKKLNSIGALKQHLKDHSGVVKPKYPCDECGLVLATPTNLKRHKEAYHNDGSTVYVCSICGKVKGTERGLMNHRKFVHEMERKHKCSHCAKAFKRPIDLQEHFAIHTGEALYQCPHCPQTFKKNSKYHDHRRKVHRVEWERSRTNRLEKQKINFEQVTSQVIV